MRYLGKHKQERAPILTCVKLYNEIKKIKLLSGNDEALDEAKQLSFKIERLTLVMINSHMSPMSHYGMYTKEREVLVT